MKELNVVEAQAKKQFRIKFNEDCGMYFIYNPVTGTYATVPASSLKQTLSHKVVNRDEQELDDAMIHLLASIPACEYPA